MGNDLGRHSCGCSRFVLLRTMPEIWKSVVGFEGCYEVSSLGAVKSVERRCKSPRGTRKVPECALAPHVDKDGYHIVSLSRDGFRWPYKVHRLVCEAFNGPPPMPDYQVCHNNADRTDNRPSNLRWGTLQENQRDRDLHGNTLSGTRNGYAKLTREEVLEIRHRSKSETRISLAAQFGVNRQTIRKIVHRRSYTDC